ncbi:MAG: adenylate cyclase [Elusimicrobia bacterium]|nr:MAG: adenylate cyclase [Elusimicrobiota bacterium]
MDPSRPDEDQKLLAATRRHGERLIHAVTNDPKLISENRFYYPYPALKAVAKSMAQVTQPVKEDDGTIRLEPLLIGIQRDYTTWAEDPEAMPSLGLKAVSLLEGKPFRDYLSLPGVIGGSLVRLNYVGQKEVLGGSITDAEGEIHEQWYVDHAIPRIPAKSVLRRTLSDDQKARIKDGIAFVGSTSLGAFDHFPSPFTGQEPGVMVHALLAENILQSRYLTVASIWLTLGLVILAVFGASMLFRLTPLKSGLAFFSIMALAFWGHYLLFLRLYIIELASPLLAFVGTFLVLVVHRTIEENRKAAEVRGMFGQYVPPEVVDILVKNPEKLKLGGEKRDMTIFFLDIAHFTTISEKMTPEALIQFLNRYLTALTDDIFDNNGVVDKYIGDCIMAFWNAPLDEKDHRRKACLAAVACVKTIDRLNKEFLDPSMPETPTVRIGLNSGEVVVGNTGSARKLAYTVLGDDVNLASRLEGANKFFGSTLMASEDTYSEGKDVVEGRLLGAVRVVGKAIPIKVYELLAKKGDLEEKWAKGIPLYHEAITHYENKRFDAALKGFEAFLKHVPDDKTAKLYMNACNDYVVIPPPEGWEPVFNLTSK